MAETPKVEQLKKGCVISLMFPCETDIDAMTIKAKIDDAVKQLPDKKYTFQIIES